MSLFDFIKIFLHVLNILFISVELEVMKINKLLYAQTTKVYDKSDT